MKRISIFLLPLLFVATALGALTELDRALLSQRNLLANPGWEGAKAGWTASGGTYTTTTTAANIGAGNASGSWDSSSGSQTLTSGSVSITSGNGLSGLNGVVSCRIKAATGTATHTIQAYDGSAALVSSTVTSSTSGFVRTSANFIFPASGTVSLRLVSVASDEPGIYIDDCYLGLADGFNIQSVSQAQLAGQSYFATTASCAWGRTNTALGAFSTDTDCPGPTIEVQKVGTWQTTDADLPQQTINNLPPGVYVVEVTGTVDNSAGANIVCLAVSDGTTTSGRACARPETGATTFPSLKATGYFEYSSAGNRTFSVYGASASGAVDLYASASNQIVQFTIYRFPNTSETAYRADLVSSSWAGFHDTNCVWSRTNTAYGDFTADATCTLTERTNVNFGTVSASGSVLPAITFTPKKAGTYFVCARASAQSSANSSYASLQLTDGTNQIATSNFRQYTTVGDQAVTETLCGLVRATSVAAITLTVQGAASSGNVVIQTGSIEKPLEWSIFSVDQSIPAPVLVGSITSGTTGQERMERATVVADAACSLSTDVTQSGSWITSCTRNASADYTLGLSGFSATPTCTVTVSRALGNTRYTPTAWITALSSSSMTIQWGYNDDQQGSIAAAIANVDDSASLHIHCMGPK